MYLLYGLLVLMLFSGICLLAIPFINTSTLLSKYFLFSALFVTVFSLGIYQFKNNNLALKQWLAHGEQHYQLQEDIQQLGGFEGMIERIKKKLAANPDDATGWFILGKLYLANQDYTHAKQALDKAAKLRPNDVEIERFYNMAAEKIK